MGARAPVREGGVAGTLLAFTGSAFTGVTGTLSATTTGSGDEVCTHKREKSRKHVETTYGLSDVLTQELPVSEATPSLVQRKAKRAERREIKKREKMLDLDLNFALNFAVQNEQDIRREIARVLQYDCA